jgi:membrane protein DedA with SNARE-associated domain
LQDHYCVAALQHRLSYNVIMSFSALVDEAVAAIAPVLAVAAPRVRHHNVTIHINGLLILLVIVLAIAGVVWLRRRSRANKNAPERPDEWPPRRPERKPEHE